MLLAAAQLAEELLDALTELDAQTAPLGLYACEEFGMAERPFPRLHPEWNRAIAPRLKALGGEPGYANLRDGEFTFTLPTGERAELQIVRLSKIKVRKFGSAYRIDNHTSFRERWQALRLDQTLKAVGNHRDGLRLFLLIGFAKEPEPFGKELTALQNSLPWEKRGAGYADRTWEDRYDRRFFVRLSLWQYAAPKDTEPSSADGL